MAVGWDVPLDAAYVVVFDVETTGLDPRGGDRVCELAALRLIGGDVSGHISTLVNPGRPIPPEATAIHGISDADVREAPTLEDILVDFARFADGAVLTAYNLPFDLSFLAAAARRAGLSPLLNPTADVLTLARRLIPGLNSYHLGDVAATLGVTNPAPHRAMGDVAVTSEIVLAFWDALSRTGQARTVAEMVRYSRGLEGTQAPVEIIAAIEWSLAAATPLDIEYDSGAGTYLRRVTPLRIYARGGQAYLMAYCHERRERRGFRLDRIAGAAVANADGA